MCGERCGDLLSLSIAASIFNFRLLGASVDCLALLLSGALNGEGLLRTDVPYDISRCKDSLSNTWGCSLRSAFGEKRPMVSVAASAMGRLGDNVFRLGGTGLF